jgi:hypothetical protein
MMILDDIDLADKMGFLSFGEATRGRLDIPKVDFLGVLS